MKLNKKTGSVSSSASQEKHAFGIGDVSVVIEILRNRLYSNPIQTLTQEYLSNGRDATREAGETKPLLVTLPTRLDSVLKVRDFGPGLSPERVKEVFVLYGASTKRTDNKQTGGFGIGAKSAWAYTDSFTVISYYKGKARTYVAHTGENANGTFELIDEESTKEPNGVEVQIPVKEEDREKFKSAVFRCTYFWETRPQLKGIVKAEIPKWYEDNKPIISGKGWGVFNLPTTWGLSTKSEDDYDEYDDDYRDLQSLFVIDGIPYDVPEVILESQEFEELKDSFKAGQVIIYFNTGEIEVSASREAVVLDKKNTQFIHKKFEEVLDDVNGSLQKEIKALKTLPEALNKFKEMEKIFTESVVSDKKYETTLDKKKVSLKIVSDYYDSHLCLSIADGKSSAWEMKSSYRSDKLKTAKGQRKDLNFIKLSLERSTSLFLNNEPLEKPEAVESKIKSSLIAANKEKGQHVSVGLITNVPENWIQKHIPEVILSSAVAKPERKKAERRVLDEGTINVSEYSSATNSFPKKVVKIEDIEKDKKAIFLVTVDGSYWKGYGANKWEILYLAQGAEKQGYKVYAVTKTQSEYFEKGQDFSDFIKSLSKQTKVSKEFSEVILEYVLGEENFDVDDFGYLVDNFNDTDIKKIKNTKIREFVQLLSNFVDDDRARGGYRPEYLAKYTSLIKSKTVEVKEIKKLAKDFEKKFPLLSMIDCYGATKAQTDALLAYINWVAK